MTSGNVATATRPGDLVSPHQLGGRQSHRPIGQLESAFLLDDLAGLAGGFEAVEGLPECLDLGLREVGEGGRGQAELVEVAGLLLDRLDPPLSG